MQTVQSDSKKKILLLSWVVVFKVVELKKKGLQLPFMINIIPIKKKKKKKKKKTWNL